MSFVAVSEYICVENIYSFLLICRTEKIFSILNVKNLHVNFNLITFFILSRAPLFLDYGLNCILTSVNGCSDVILRYERSHVFDSVLQLL
jgi:hypothetical protein